MSSVINATSHDIGSYKANTEYHDNGSVSSFSPTGSSYSDDYSLGGSNARAFIDYIDQYDKKNYKRYKEARSYNESLYNNSLAWYERMQNTSIQRQVEDLKRAGINPIFASRLGGYSVAMPNVPYTQASMPYADVGNVGSVLSSQYATDVGYKENIERLGAEAANVMRQCETQIYDMLLSTESARDVASIYAQAEKYVSDTTNYLKNIIDKRDNAVNYKIHDELNKINKQIADNNNEMQKYIADERNKNDRLITEINASEAKRLEDLKAANQRLYQQRDQLHQKEMQQKSIDAAHLDNWNRGVMNNINDWATTGMMIKGAMSY